MLPGVNEKLLYDLYELDYDIPSASLKYGNRVVYPGLCCLSYEQATPEQQAIYQQRSVTQSWDSVVSALQQLAPHIAQHLEAGVTSAEIKQAEQRLHLILPDDVKAWYRLANGRSKQDDFWKFLVDTWHWLPIEYLGWQEWMAPLGVHLPTEIVPIRGKFLLSADARIQPVWKHPQWIPFMIHNQRAVLCIDMAPTAQGQVGQIILSLASAEAYKPWGPLDIRQVPPVVWVAPSLRLFLAALSQDLTDGKYTADEYRFLWSQEGLAFKKLDPNDRESSKDYA